MLCVLATGLALWLSLQGCARCLLVCVTGLAVIAGDRPIVKNGRELLAQAFAYKRSFSRATAVMVAELR